LSEHSVDSLRVVNNSSSISSKSVNYRNKKIRITNKVKSAKSASSD